MKNFTDIQIHHKYFSYSEHPSRVKSQTGPVLFLQTATIILQAVLLFLPSVGSSFGNWPQIFYTRFLLCNIEEFVKLIRSLSYFLLFNSILHNVISLLRYKHCVLLLFRLIYIPVLWPVEL
jgi:hypothetical protein